MIWKRERGSETYCHALILDLGLREGSLANIWMMLVSLFHKFHLGMFGSSV